jgi:hypothetical protein
MEEPKTIIAQTQDSVEIGINAKGKWSGKLKVYAKNVKEAYEIAITR